MLAYEGTVPPLATPRSGENPVELSLQIRLSFEMKSRFRVYANNSRGRDASDNNTRYSVTEVKYSCY